MRLERISFHDSVSETSFRFMASRTLHDETPGESEKVNQIP